MKDYIILICEKNYHGFREEGRATISNMVPPVWTQPPHASLTLEQVQSLLSVAYGSMTGLKCVADLSSCSVVQKEIHSGNGEES